MVSAILFLAVVMGLGLRLARWVDCLPLRATRLGGDPRPRGLASLFGTGL